METIAGLKKTTDAMPLSRKRKKRNDASQQEIVVQPKRRKVSFGDDPKSGSGDVLPTTLTNDARRDCSYYHGMFASQNEKLLELLREPHETDLSRKGHPPNPQNMVFTVSMGDGFSPREISSHFLQTEYKPKQFAAVVCRITDINGNTTVLIFSTGKMVCVGGKTEEEVITQLQKYRRILASCGYRTDFSDLTLHNLVCNAHVGHPIDIKAFSESDPNNTVYNPELFPGAIKMVHLKDGRAIIFLVFDTGNIICMGLKTLEEAAEAIGIIVPILALYKSDKASIDSKKNRRTPKPAPQSKKPSRTGKQKTPPKTDSHTTTSTQPPLTQKGKGSLTLQSVMGYIKRAEQNDMPSVLAAISRGDIDYLEEYKRTHSKKKKSMSLAATDEDQDVESIASSLGDIPTIL